MKGANLLTGLCILKVLYLQSVLISPILNHYRSFVGYSYLFGVFLPWERQYSTSQGKKVKYRVVVPL